MMGDDIRDYSDNEPGWRYWNPDTGVEWAPSHPIGSGECDDAEDIEPMTYGEFIKRYPQAA